MEEFLTDIPVAEEPTVRTRGHRTTKQISRSIYRSLALEARKRAQADAAHGEKQIYLIIATELDRLRKARGKQLSVWRRCGARRHHPRAGLKTLADALRTERRP